MKRLLDDMKLSPIDPQNPDGVALTSIAHPPGLLESMAEAIERGPLTVRWLQCKDCGWRLDDGAVGYPECAKCGAAMHLHMRPA